MTREPYYKYFIRSAWHGRVETPAAIGAKFLATLDALSGIDPIFKNWMLADFPNPSSGDPDVDGWNIKAIPVASARNRITEVVWGDRDVSENNLDVFIRFLRNKVDQPGLSRLVHTERGIGYSVREGLS